MWLPNYLRMRYDLHRCQTATAQLEKDRPPNTRDAYESGQIAEYVKESNSLFEWRHLILTRYWQSKADGLGVPMPPMADKSFWDRADFDNDESQPPYLTEAGILEIRKAIREEHKYRRETFGFWVMLIVGLIGALSGLASVLKLG